MPAKVGGLIFPFTCISIGAYCACEVVWNVETFFDIDIYLFKVFLRN